MFHLILNGYQFQYLGKRPKPSNGMLLAKSIGRSSLWMLIVPGETSDANPTPSVNTVVSGKISSHFWLLSLRRLFIINLFLQLFRRVAAALPGMDSAESKPPEDSILFNNNLKKLIINYMNFYKLPNIYINQYWTIFVVLTISRCNNKVNVSILYVAFPLVLYCIGHPTYMSSANPSFPYI